jgi:hypothetical protein
MTPRTKLIEVWPKAWYLVIERTDKPASIEIGRIGHPDYPNHYATWMVWARAIGPFAHPHDAFVEVKHFHPYLGVFEPMIVSNAEFLLHALVLTRHITMALVANAVPAADLPDPIAPEGFDALDQIVICDCGNQIPLEPDEENGFAVVWCPSCRKSVDIKDMLLATALAYGEGY